MSENQPPSYPGEPHPSQPGGGQPPYGQQPPPGQQPYGAQKPYGQWRGPLPKHPQATTVLVLGIIGLIVCQVLSPFAWVMGSKAVREIDANPGAYEGRGEAQAGRILGIIGTVFLILVIASVVLFFTFVVLIGVSSSSTSDFSELSLIGR